MLLCALVVLLGTSAEVMHFHTHSSQTQPLSNKTNGTCLICHTPGTFLAASPVVAYTLALTVQGSAVPVLIENRTKTSVFDLFVRPPPILAC